MAVDNVLRTPSATGAASRGVVVATLAVAALLTAVTTASGAVRVVQEAVSGVVDRTLVADVPLQPSAHLVHGAYSAAEVTVRNLPGGVLALVVATDVAALVAQLCIGTALVLLCAVVLRRSPFTRRLGLRLTVLGGVAADAAIVSSGFGALASTMVAQVVGGLPVAGRFDPTGIAIGVGLMVVGLLADHGRRLEVATDGLV